MHPGGRARFAAFGRPIFKRGIAMLHYSLVFFVVALLAGVLGFSGVSGAAADIAKILFVLFTALAVVSYIVNRLDDTCD